MHWSVVLQAGVTDTTQARDALAHLGYTLSPFAITWVWVPQLAQALDLEIFCAGVFHQTRSLLCLILVHIYFNFTLTAQGMLWALLRR